MGFCPPPISGCQEKMPEIERFTTLMAGNLVNPFLIKKQGGGKERELDSHRNAIKHLCILRFCYMIQVDDF